MHNALRFDGKSCEELGQIYLDEALKRAPDLQLMMDLAKNGAVAMNLPAEKLGNLVAGCLQAKNHLRSFFIQVINCLSSHDDYRKLVDFLIEKGEALATFRTDRGNTALMEVAHSVHGKAGREICERLIALGADVEAKTDKGLTALMVAAIYGNKEVGAFLAPLASDLHETDASGRSALDWASEIPATIGDRPGITRVFQAEQGRRHRLKVERCGAAVYKGITEPIQPLEKIILRKNQ